MSRLLSIPRGRQAGGTPNRFDPRTQASSVSHPGLRQASGLSAGGSTLFSTSRGYDAVGNVTSVQTTLPAGTDAQSFCYDEQNRLVWASSQTGSGPNGCASNTAGTLTGQSALYTASYAYDNLNRLTSGPAGSSYTYGDSAHLHAATSTNGGYTATYDASGNLLCRAPSSSMTCAGQTPTGSQLAYDNEGRLVGWQNAPSSPTTTDTFAYDGAGSRVAQQVVSSGVTTTTDYLLGGREEVTAGTLTEYYLIPGIGTAVRVGSSGSSTLSYLASDDLGSLSVALSTSGTVTASALYSPYGSVRYQSGTMPTAKGYTGQYADGVTGLDYYNARYYDPALGQFAQADSFDGGGLNRYAYVAGNPETTTDPSGHCWLVCAVIAAVVTTVVVTTVQAVAQYVTTGQVDWGSDLANGAKAGLLVGATILLGPAAELVSGAIAGAVSGGATALGASAVAGDVAGTAIAGGIMGAGEGVVQGAFAGDRGGDLLADAGIGAISGGVGGAVGSYFGKTATRFARAGLRLNPERWGAVAAGFASSATANLASQGFQMWRGRQEGFDAASLVISAGVGTVWGASITSDRPTIKFFGQHPFWTAATFAGIDAGAQMTRAFMTGQLGGNYSGGGIYIHRRQVW